MIPRTLLFLSLVLFSPAAEMKAPDGYDVRDFGSMGGQILVPKGWFVTVAETPGGSLYTMSREDSQKGAYDTGMRLQTFSHVKKLAGTSPKEAVQAELQRRKGKEEVVHECAGEEFGVFHRICLETLAYISKSKPAQRYHLVYSFWWNDDSDILMAVTFGAPVEEWPEAQKIYQTIKDVKVVDLDRVKKEPNSEVSEGGQK